MNTEDQAALRQASESWFTGMSWRHHGTGLLQGDIPGFPEHRIHIWNKEQLLLEGMRESGAMHNHRFHLRSHLLVGTLTHTHIQADHTPGVGMFSLWGVYGDAGTSKDFGCHGHCDARFAHTRRYKAGESYEVLKWKFHYARQEDADTLYTITLVNRTYKSLACGTPPTVLAPYMQCPVNAFSAEASAEVKQLVLVEAKRLLAICP